MNKRAWPVVLLLVVLFLTGCSCTHQWAQADCLSPQTCVECGETGQGALGHVWSDATCAEPQRCLRCGQIQGEPLGHSFGDWLFGESEMTHTCIRCDLTESAELDRQQQLETLLPGLWEFYGLFQGEAFYSAYNLAVPGDCLTFGPERTVTGMIDQAAFSGSWKLVEYQENEHEQLFYFSAGGADGRSIHMLYKLTSEDEILYCFYADDVQVLLSRNDEAAAGIVGTWGAKGLGTMYSLTFHEDRSVTGNLGEEFEGTWQLLPVRDGHSTFLDGSMYGMFIRYLQDGQELLLMATVSPCERSGDDAAEEFAAETITLTLDGNRFTFEAMTPEEIRTQATAMQEGPNMLIGTWSSTYYRTFTTNSNTDKLAMDYTFTFLSDGTFTASAGKELSGTWEYKDSWGDVSNGKHMYYLYFAGERLPCDMELEYSQSHVPQLSIQNGSAVHHILFLNKRSARQDHIARSLIGSWTSLYAENRSPGSDNYDRVNTMDYSFTFCADGTFTGNDGASIRGSWVYESTRDETVCQYNLFLSGQTYKYASITLYDQSDAGEVTKIEFRTHSEETGTRYIWLENLSPEDLEAALLGPTFILGQWFADDGKSITFHEDGTFTANLDTTFQGTWSFRRYNSGSAYWYDFTYPGQSEYGDKTLYAHTGEDLLTFRIYTDAEEEFYQMHRSR